MASIRRRNGRYHVQIRKNGYQTLTHTLSSLSLARKSAAGVEADMERHLYIEVSEQPPLLSLLNRYQDEVFPLHKGSKSELPTAVTSANVLPRFHWQFFAMFKEHVTCWIINSD